MTNRPELDGVLTNWTLPDGQDLLDRVELMIRPALLAGHFGKSFTRFVSGLQYHLGGAQDTRELAQLAGLSDADRVLDVCCFIGGPAIQLADSIGCRVTGIDLDAAAIAAATRIADVTGLSRLLKFEVANAGDLPFSNESYSVVWNQCSLEPNEHWLQEFDRILESGGRFAFTFQRKGKSDQRWTLDHMTSLLQGMGYVVTHADDITERDIEIGWKALDSKLSELESEFRSVLGDEWVKKAHQEFRSEVEKMKNGEYGNARIVATKPSSR
jgi:ubiquinone/menaquinone biosynthesis C-methylase UbiE